MARKNRPPDHPSVIEITKRYADVEGKLRMVVYEAKNVGVAEQKRRITEATKAAEQTLSKANKKYADSLSGAFATGRKRTESTAKKAATIPKPGDKSLERTNSRENGTGGKEAFKAVRRGAFIDLQNGMTGALAGLRKTVGDTIRGLDDKNRNISAFTRAITDKLREGGLLEVRYENGAHIKLGSYAKMLARSSRIETENLGSFAAATELGSDLVKCVGQSPTCELCAIYRNRVFCVSGKDNRFPALYDGADAPLREGYHVIHPNCRCEFVPYFEDLEGKAQVEKDIAFSNRPFKDSRTKRERDDYTAWQAGNRQLWSEQAEYENMKATLGDKMPYKSLGGFRTARRNFNDAVKAGKLDKNTAVEYNKYAKTKWALQDKKLQADIIVTQPKAIIEGKQGKHIVGHNNYQPDKSRLTIDFEEAQELVNKCAGIGEIQRTESGKWRHTELVEYSKQIGVCIDKNGKEVSTNFAIIHYSKNGTHIVPTLRKRK